MNIPKLEELVGGACKEASIKLHYPEFYDYLLSTYPELTFKERIYWYYNNITERPRCICGNLTKFKNIKQGYQQYCSKKCLNNDPIKLQKSKQTCLEKYGDENFRNLEKSRQTSMSRYGVSNVMKSEEKRQQSINTRMNKYGGCGNASPISKQKYKDTCKARYNHDNPMKNDSIQQKLFENNLKKFGSISPFSLQSVKDKSIQTCIERYGIEHYTNNNLAKSTMLERHGYEYNFQNPDILDRGIQTRIEKYGDPNYNNIEKYKQTCLSKYGVSSPTQLASVRQKIYDTKRNNHTFNISSIEEQFSSYLDSQNIVYERQYKCERYPYACDFYIPKYDLFIEINGSWTHGDHPYTNSEEDRKIVDYWRSKNSKYYNNAIQTWTNRDIEKREIAKQNNLNYLEVFSNKLKDVINEYERRINIRSES